MLTFDVEEFDTPLEYKVTLSLKEQIAIPGMAQDHFGYIERKRIYRSLFYTVEFATHAGDIIGRICPEGHELASPWIFLLSGRTNICWSQRKTSTAIRPDRRF